MSERLIAGVFALAVLLPAAAPAANVTFGMTTTQEASGVAEGIRTALSEAFDGMTFSYAVAGTAATLRSLEEGFIPFAVTHNATREEELVAKGQHARHQLFSNDFLVVGPAEGDLDCPDGVGDCLARIAAAGLPFLSRGDQSGTHLYELSQWQAHGIDPETLEGYRVATGGAANGLRICAVQKCLSIADEATFDSGRAGNLVEIARDPGSNLYSLVYRVDAEVALDPLAPIISWIKAEVPGLAETYGYRAYAYGND